MWCLHPKEENLESHTSTFKVIPGFTSFPRSPQPTVKVKSASNVQHYNLATLVLSMNSYRLIVPGHTPNVHLIPSSNANDQNKSIPTFPSLLHSPSGNPVIPSVQSLTFHVLLAPPSWEIHPLERLSHIGRYKNWGISRPRNHHIGHNMLMEINGHY